MRNPAVNYPSAASTGAAVLFISLALLISGCSEATDNKAPATVLSAPQQQGLNSAQQMEQQLQKDVERREQQMRDQDI
ncbi:hypothetical protein AB4876_11730 [Zhongshania guokunii]|uniref:Uncharacterized protein n=1 Tax=Zhongshania guokunii TaxID=641783 RepID=A0ABV3U813_9GAMM